MASEVLAAFQRQIKAVDDGLWGKATLLAAKKYFSFSNEVAAHFFGQCSVESAGFTVFTENLNYSAKRLLEVFPTYFNAQNVQKYANCPRKIASRVYANRLGNGNEASEDGWKYRGRGAIQLTGKSNYKAFEKWLKLTDLNPDDVADKYYWETALFFF